MSIIDDIPELKEIALMDVIVMFDKRFKKLETEIMVLKARVETIEHCSQMYSFEKKD